MSAIAVSDSKMSGGGAAEGAGGTMFGGGVVLQTGLESKVVLAVDAKTRFNLSTPLAPPPRQVKKSSQPLFFFPRADGVGAGGSLDMAAWLSLPSLVFALHSVVAGSQSPAVCGAELRRWAGDPAAADRCL